MRFDSRGVSNCLAQTFNFAVRKRIGFAIKAYQAYDARNFQHPQTQTECNTNKNITGKEWQFELHAPVFPTPHRTVERKKVLHSPRFEVRYDPFFLIRTGVRGKPC